MLQEGFELMGVGMVVVFAFLILLVFSLELSTRFFEKFGHLFPDPAPDETPAQRPSGPAPDLAVAVAAAARKRTKAGKG